MKTGKRWRVGDTYYEGAGLLHGREVDDSSTDPHATREAAQTAIEDEWLTFLSPREQEAAETYVRRWRVAAVSEDGEIDAAGTIPDELNPPN